jgi:NAD(P)-dependent dehydrogenase (short-subunit alcohol dehydrogenase family)
LEVTVTSRQDPGEPSVEDLTEPRVAVVTGASSGIGLVAAEELARRGRERRLAAKATEPALAGALWEASRQAVKV